MPRREDRTPRWTPRPGGGGRRRMTAALALLMALLVGARAWALDLEDETLADRPVSSIRIVIRSKKLASEQEIRNNLRIATGQPFDAKVVKADVSTLYRLGRFGQVTADATILPDGSVEVGYTVEEQQIVDSIDFAGNYVITDQELRKAVPLTTGAPPKCRAKRSVSIVAEVMISFRSRRFFTNCCR